MVVTVSSTDRRDGKALALFARWQDWQQGHTRDGRPFFAIPGRESGLFHMADQRECSCPDFQQARNLCKHVRAVRLWMAAFQTGAVTPKSRPTILTITDDAGTGDDLVILTPAGAAYLAKQEEAENLGVATDDEIDRAFAYVADGKRAQRRASYAALFGTDDDKPWCTACNRHHEAGRHYLSLAR